MSRNTVEFESLVGWMDWVLERKQELVFAYMECSVICSGACCRLWAYTKNRVDGLCHAGSEIPMVLETFDALSSTGDVRIEVLQAHRDKIEQAYEKIRELLRELREDAASMPERSEIYNNL